jgi:spore coat polysaccharide biosynthesis protein SpsF
MSSSRLPGKVMAVVNGQPLIYWQIRRIQKAKEISKLVIATSTDGSDAVLVDYVLSLGVAAEKGPLDDVFLRFLNIILDNPDHSVIVRLTGDCPLTMPSLLDEMIQEFAEGDYDYYSNCVPPTFPDGLDIEIFTKEAFISLSRQNLTVQEREHVTLGFRNYPNLFKVGNKSNRVDLSDMRWTVDYEEDLEFIKSVFRVCQGREDTINLPQMLELLENNPNLETRLSGNLRNIALKNLEGTT